MRRVSAMVVIVTSLFLWPALAAAQEELSSDQLRRMYDDTVAQMKAAQDRRNELAHENNELASENGELAKENAAVRARIVELEKRVEKARAEARAEAQVEVATMADNTFKARSERAALDEFLQANPSIKAQWMAFLQQHRLPGFDIKRLLDPDWPLRRLR